jgi:ribosome assembly protein YihI (activator of Der GTPase)
MTSHPDKSYYYVQRHCVRKFLLTYATPSALDEMLDSFDNMEPLGEQDQNWKDLVREVRQSIGG